MPARSALLSDAIDEYLGFLAARRMAANTIKSNKYLLKRALSEWGNVQVCNLQPRHVDRLFSAASWGPRTHNTNLQFLRAFFAWCRNQGYMNITQDPAFGWRNLRIPWVDRLRVPVERFPELLDAAEHPRDRAIIALGLFLFLRGSEITTLRISDLDFKRDLVTIYRHKTKEQDTLPMCSELRTEMNRYLNWYREQKGGLAEHWLLVPARQYGSNERSRINGKYVTDANQPLADGPMTHPYLPVKKALDAIGFDTAHEGNHTLRRSGARALADSLRYQGFDGALMRVASMLGHKDIKQTSHYIGWGLERQQRNEQFAGKPMFATIFNEPGKLVLIEGEVNGNDDDASVRRVPADASPALFDSAEQATALGD